jgi:hypothetical protein
VKKLGKVDLNMENINKCLCKVCPVQTDSKCSKDKLKKVNEMIEKEGTIINLVKAEEIPLVYCSSGISNCSDLSDRELCKCTQCAVWLENNLANSEPLEYFCIDGAPK